MTAEMLGINPHSRTDARKIEQDTPEILDYGKQGKLSIPQAKTVAPSLTDRLLASPLLAEGSLVLVLGGKLLPDYQAPPTLAHASSPA